MYRQYAQVYGPLTDEGRYQVGEQVLLVDRTQGKVIWKYMNQKLGLIYVRPHLIEISASLP